MANRIRPNLFCEIGMSIVFTALCIARLAAQDLDELNSSDNQSLFSDGLAPVRQDGKYGYISPAGKLVIQPKFEWAGRFSDGFACVISNQKIGYIQVNGEFKIDSQYDLTVDVPRGPIASFVAGYFSGKQVIREKDGTYSVFPPELQLGRRFHDQRVCIRQAKLYGFADESGREIVKPTYESATDFFGGLAMVKKDHKFGFIDPNGEFVLPSRFGEATPYVGGIAVTRNGKSWTFIDVRGREVGKIECDLVGLLSEGRIPFVRNGMVGYCDSKGEVVVPPEYGLGGFSGFSEGLARVKKDGKFGYIEPNGKMMIPAEYSFGSLFRGGIAAVETTDGEFSLIDRQGKLKTLGKCTWVAPFSDGYALVLKDDLNGPWGYVDKDGKVIWAPSR